MKSDLKHGFCFMSYIFPPFVLWGLNRTASNPSFFVCVLDGVDETMYLPLKFQKANGCKVRPAFNRMLLLAVRNIKYKIFFPPLCLKLICSNPAF